jgi:NADH pyrophosphatase NudC (nudix superfamily)
VTDEILDQYLKSYDPPIPAQIMMSWAPELEPGKHEARIEITRDNGEVLEYSWSFKITR